MHGQLYVEKYICTYYMLNVSDVSISNNISLYLYMFGCRVSINHVLPPGALPSTTVPLADYPVETWNLVFLRYPMGYVRTTFRHLGCGQLWMMLHVMFRK